MPTTEIDQLREIASTAPRAAPVETPSVNGVASALRSSPWKTTPADAKSAPTAAPASVRGSLAMKKICASVLSANGIEKSKARDSAMRVGPIERRQDQRRAQQRRETGDRSDEALLQAHGWLFATRPVGTSTRRPDG